jgi:hypothetical protein
MKEETNVALQPSLALTQRREGMSSQTHAPQSHEKESSMN